MPYPEAKNLGVNLVALGNDKVLSMPDAKTFNQQISALQLSMNFIFSLRSYLIL